MPRCFFAFLETEWTRLVNIQSYKQHGCKFEAIPGLKPSGGWHLVDVLLRPVQRAWQLLYVPEINVAGRLVSRVVVQL
jgi:hypothetical protein